MLWAGSSWRERVELVGACGGVQLAVVDKDGAEVLAHGERRGEVDRIHRPQRRGVRVTEPQLECTDGTARR